ncbi:MAG TPA: D-glucuronyl C5-epimerase family protein [Nitrososphaeraceae archaeon]|nr:D-glucuronyl C5-epimerase family protein [Nitrososphaeraceae archaeon]
MNVLFSRLIWLVLTLTIITALNNILLIAHSQEIYSKGSFLTYNDTIYHTSINYHSNWEIQELSSEFLLSVLENISSSEKQTLDNNDDGDAAATDSTTVNNNGWNETEWSDIEYLSDANNNTMVDYKNLFGLNIGKVYNPNFVDNADWFLDSSNYEDHVDYYLIPYNYNWDFYSEISAPWYGCEGQSKAMLVTAKKYNETGDYKYLEFSKKVFNGLNSPVLNQDGWLLAVVTENKNSTILNSHLFCVANLMAYYEYTGDERALKLFKKGVDVLEKNIDDLSIFFKIG